MAHLFNGCKGKTLCKENETGCRTCGRSLDEIQTTRQLIDGLANFIVDMGYENINDFMSYVASKVSKKVSHLKNQKQQAVSNGFHRMG
jgi:hypothetical protein